MRKVILKIIRSGFILILFVGILNIGGTMWAQENPKAFQGLRNQLINTKFEDLNIPEESLAGKNKIWAVLMETGFKKGSFTLVSIITGDASIYFSNGGGIIGGIGHENVAKSAISMVKTADNFFESAQKTTSYPLPKEGETVFYFLTTAGVYTAEAPENDLGEKRHPLSALFYAGQNVITQLRIIDENAKNSKKVMPSLIVAASSGEAESVQQMINKGENIDITDETGLTPLMAASFLGDSKIVEIILKAGANIEQKDNEGLTALMFACNAGKLDVVKILLTGNAEINAKDKDNSTPIMFAAQYGFDDIVELLLSKGADPIFKGNHGMTAIDFAKQNKQISTVVILEEGKIRGRVKE